MGGWGWEGGAAVAAAAAIASQAPPPLLSLLPRWLSVKAMSREQAWAWEVRGVVQPAGSALPWRAASQAARKGLVAQLALAGTALPSLLGAVTGSARAHWRVALLAMPRKSSLNKRPAPAAPCPPLALALALPPPPPPPPPAAVAAAPAPPPPPCAVLLLGAAVEALSSPRSMGSSRTHLRATLSLTGGA